MLLTARRILLIHVLMRLPDFVKPVVAAADRFVQRIQESKLCLAVSCLAISCPQLSARRVTPTSRGHIPPQRLPRSKTHAD